MCFAQDGNIGVSSTLRTPAHDAHAAHTAQRPAARLAPACGRSGGGGGGAVPGQLTFDAAMACAPGHLDSLSNFHSHGAQGRLNENLLLPMLGNTLPT